ncbi:MAG: sporulation protein YunB [Firmicutes bacterium]|nr:sporulation protein YunB [Bacillota bacterium]
MFRRRRRFFTKRKMIVLISIVLIVLLAYMFIVRYVNPVIRVLSEEKVRELTTLAINEAAEVILLESGHDNDDLVEVIRNNEGNIEMLRVNTVALNLMAMRVANLSQQRLADLGEQGLRVPIGTLSGLTFLAGRGPDFNIRAYPVGAVDISFATQFISAGINQTRHKIMLNVDTEMSVILPGVQTFETRTELILVDSIIVGQIPDTVLNMGMWDNILNLVP